MRQVVTLTVSQLTRVQSRRESRRVRANDAGPESHREKATTGRQREFRRWCRATRTAFGLDSGWWYSLNRCRWVAGGRASASPQFLRSGGSTEPRPQPPGVESVPLPGFAFSCGLRAERRITTKNAKRHEKHSWMRAEFCFRDNAQSVRSGRPSVAESRGWQRSSAQNRLVLTCCLGRVVGKRLCEDGSHKHHAHRVVGPQHDREKRTDDAVRRVFLADQEGR